MGSLVVRAPAGDCFRRHAATKQDRCRRPRDRNGDQTEQHALKQCDRERHDDPEREAEDTPASIGCSNAHCSRSLAGNPRQPFTPRGWSVRVTCARYGKVARFPHEEAGLWVVRSTAEAVVRLGIIALVGSAGWRWVERLEEPDLEQHLDHLENVLGH